MKKHTQKKSWAHNGHRNIALLRSNIGTSRTWLSNYTFMSSSNMPPHHTTFSGPRKALRKSASRLQVKPNGRSRPPPPFPSLGGSKARSLNDPRRTYDPTKPRVPDYAFGFIPQSPEPVAVAFALKPNIPQTQSPVTGMLT